MYLNNLKSDDSRTIANLFAKTFSDNYSTVSAPQIDRRCYGTHININHIQLNEVDTFHLLNNLPKHTCRGPDEISPALFKSCAGTLAAPLTLIFQRSIDTGIFPDRWKLSYISPIFKSGDKNSIKNYRPVSISSIIPKVFENLVSRQLYQILSTIIVENQHGFLKGKSTATNLVSFSEFVTTAIEEGDQVDCVYTDFSKCFDRINHDLLISKLYAIGIGGNLLSWIKSFHLNRKQKVKLRVSNYSPSSNTNTVSDASDNYNSVYSDEIHVNSGCIQGGHFYGILFLCFVNDIVSILSPNH